MASSSVVVSQVTAAFVLSPTMIASKPPPPSPNLTSRSSTKPRRLYTTSTSSPTKGATDKKVAQAAAAATNAANASVDAAVVVATKQQRKRGRVSDLTRKYRQVSDMDESILIGDNNDVLPGVPLFPNSQNKNTSSRSKTTSKKSLSKSPIDNFETINTNISSSSQSIKRRRPIPSYSLFPSKWDDAVSQMCGSVALALARGFDRLKIDVEEIYPYLQEQQKIQQPLLLNEVNMLTHAACLLLEHIIGKDASKPSLEQTEYHHSQLIQQQQNQANMEALSTSNKTSNKNVTNNSSNNKTNKTNKNKKVNISSNFRPKGAVLLFNSRTDLQLSGHIIKEYLPKNVILGVVGEINPSYFVGNVVIVVSPSNCNNNPTHIEHVEHVHYSNFNLRNWVIFLNPNLISLSNFQSVQRELKQPLFMADYLSTYYLEPISFPNLFGCKGGVLRCFPRKWELYMSKFDPHQQGGSLRLVSEQMRQPSREKIHCEFHWRIERELERGPDELLRVG